MGKRGSSSPEESCEPADFSVLPAPDGALVLRFSGSWLITAPRPATAEVHRKIAPLMESAREVRFDCAGLTHWDSSFLAALFSFLRSARTSQEKPVRLEGLPEGAGALLELACAVPERKSENGKQGETSVLARIGSATVGLGRSIGTVVPFIGEITLAFFRFLRGAARIRTRDLLELLTECGPKALPIVSLISALVGLIFAFIGAIQLEQFGAKIYVANLVGIAMAREMAAVMVGVIMAGRTGAAFAAQIGTMEVNEEVDALKTLGISPIEFLVLPRMLALIVTMPLMCAYANLCGIAGGALVSALALDISPVLYLQQTKAAVALSDLWVGIVKSIVFGALVALCGCYHGIRCGRSASAVGLATTSAVVSSIVCIVIADAVFAVVCNILGV